MTLLAGASEVGPVAADTPLVTVNDNPAAHKIGTVFCGAARPPSRATSRFSRTLSNQPDLGFSSGPEYGSLRALSVLKANVVGAALSATARPTGGFPRRAVASGSQLGLKRSPLLEISVRLVGDPIADSGCRLKMTHVQLASHPLR